MIEHLKCDVERRDKMQYKPYLNYKDIQELMCCPVNTAYEIMDKVLEKVDKERMPPFKTKRVPTDILIKMYPCVKGAIKK